MEYEINLDATIRPQNFFRAVKFHCENHHDRSEDHIMWMTIMRKIIERNYSSPNFKLLDLIRSIYISNIYIHHTFKKIDSSTISRVSIEMLEYIFKVRTYVPFEDVFRCAKKMSIEQLALTIRHEHLSMEQILQLDNNILHEPKIRDAIKQMKNPGINCFKKKLLRLDVESVKHVISHSLLSKNVIKRYMLNVYLGSDLWQFLNDHKNGIFGGM